MFFKGFPVFTKKTLPKIKFEKFEKIQKKSRKSSNTIRKYFWYIFQNPQINFENIVDYFYEYDKNIVENILKRQADIINKINTKDPRYKNVDSRLFLLLDVNFYINFI